MEGKRYNVIKVCWKWCDACVVWAERHRPVQVAEKNFSKQYTLQLETDASFQGHVVLLVTQTHMYVHYMYCHAVWEIRYNSPDLLLWT